MKIETTITSVTTTHSDELIAVSCGGKFAVAGTPPVGTYHPPIVTFYAKNDAENGKAYHVGRKLLITIEPL